MHITVTWTDNLVVVVLYKCILNSTIVLCRIALVNIAYVRTSRIIYENISGVNIGGYVYFNQRSLQSHISALKAILDTQYKPN